LLAPSLEEERQKLIETAEAALGGRPKPTTLSPWRWAELSASEDCKEFHRMENTSQNLFKMTLFGAQQFVELGGIDARVTEDIRYGLQAFEEKLFNYLEQQTKPFVSKISRKRR
jgi:hypothetical protein